jgi:hypothetical protein
MIAAEKPVPVNVYGRNSIIICLPEGLRGRSGSKEPQARQRQFQKAVS